MILLSVAKIRKSSLYPAIYGGQMRAVDGGEYVLVCCSAPPDTAFSRAGRNNLIGANRYTSELGKPTGIRLRRV